MSLFTSSFKKYRLVIELFIGIAFIALVLMLFMFIADHLVKRSDNNQTGKVNLAMSGKISYDIVCFGSSVSEAGFNSSIVSSLTELSAYNLSLDGTRIRQSAPLILEVISQPTKPKVVVFGLSFFELDSIEGLMAPDRFYACYSNANIKTMFNDLDPDFARDMSTVPFYKISQYNHTYYKNMMVGLKNLMAGKSCEVDPNLGYTPVNQEFNTRDLESVEGKKNKIPIVESQFDFFSQLLDDINEKEIRPVFVIYPIYKSAYHFYENYDQYMKSIKYLAESKNVILLDYSTSDVSKTQEYFYNFGHLNQDGADVISKRIGTDLKHALDSLN